MSGTPKLRCAVYTRKSTEEGLDQDFNSLDAQREACVAYIASQIGLGWKLIPDRYDDGGISGGTMERPALQRLLQDIRERRVDVVVVYKIDRLTRSLMDFSRIVEIFDGSGVSFVSVTQAFNTTSSMGRLTLNVLLSFAQFEREVTAERIRDKIAASRKKGMWMGGRIPFGYSVKDRKLVINEEEAGHVRFIFQRYLDLKSVLALTDEVNRRGIGRASGGDGNAYADSDGDIDADSECNADDGNRKSTDWTRGKLYYLLANHIYIGKVRHRDRHFDGDHEAIIDADRFERVQTLLSTQAPRRKSSSNAADLHRLTGMLFDETGDRLSPAHASNHGRRYRYYVSARLKSSRAKSGDGWRVPAAELEAAIDDQLKQLLADHQRLASWMQATGDVARLQRVLYSASARLAAFDQNDREALLSQVVRRISLHPDRIDMQVDTNKLLALLEGRPTDFMNGEADTTNESDDLPLTNISTPISIRRRGQETRMVIDISNASSRRPDAALVDVIARAHLYLGKLTDGANRSIADVADLCGVHRADISRILPLAFLAPKIVEKILNGSQPADLTIRKLARMTDLPLGWPAQEAVLVS